MRSFPSVNGFPSSFITSHITSPSVFFFAVCFVQQLEEPKLLTLFVAFNQGLITEGRDNIDPEALPFARKTKEMERQGLKEGASLVEVVCILNLSWQ